MSLLQRTPRVAYRIYDEEEFLSSAVAEPGLELAAASPTRPGRLAAVAALVAVSGATYVLVARDQPDASGEHALAQVIRERRSALTAQRTRELRHERVRQLSSGHRVTADAAHMPRRRSDGGSRHGGTHERAGASSAGRLESLRPSRRTMGSEVNAQPALRRATGTEFGFER